MLFLATLPFAWGVELSLGVERISNDRLSAPVGPALYGALELGEAVSVGLGLASYPVAGRSERDLLPHDPDLRRVGHRSDVVLAFAPFQQDWENARVSTGLQVASGLTTTRYVFAAQHPSPGWDLYPSVRVGVFSDVVREGKGIRARLDLVQYIARDAPDGATIELQRDLVVAVDFVLQVGDGWPR